LASAAFSMTHSSLASTVPADAAGSALLAWLTRRFRYLDEHGWLEQIAAGRVDRNGAPATAADVLAAGDVVRFAPARADVPSAPVPVLLADADLVVVDKPPRLVVHAAGAFPQHTFLDALAREHPPRDAGARLEPVHRLDRDTSGVLVLARHREAARALQRQFEARAVDKQYVAVVEGRVAVDTLRIDAPIGRAPDSAVAVRRAVVAASARDARVAVTDVTVLARLDAHTVVRLTPHTGRTHQLRVHLAHAGHPIAGDKLYGCSDEQYADWVRHLKSGGDARTRDGKPVQRQLLHAARLRCRHPSSGAELELEAQLPPDFAPFVASG
jgi:23S rRNA pseudouridine1911/1915/1917 synthase